MIKAIIFDSDGMLTHDPGFSKTYAKEHGIPLEVMTPFFTGPFKAALVGKADLKEELQKGWLEKWGWKKSIDELLQYWFAVGSPPNPELIASILELRERGVTCVLATNQEKRRTDHMLGAFGYAKVFDRVFSSAYVGYKKPTSEFFDQVRAFLETKHPGIKREEIMFWDDDPENVEGARAYGFEAHQFTDAATYKREIERGAPKLGEMLKGE